MAGRWRYVAAPRRTSMSQAKDRAIWADKIKTQAVALYIATGSPSTVAKELNVPYNTITTWQATQWWKDAIKASQQENLDKVDVKLTKAIDKALDQIMDRLEQGEYIWDPKTGRVKQMPAKLRDLNTAFSSLMDKRQLIRKQPTKIIEQQSTAAQLQDLAKQFSAFVTGRTKGETFDTLVEKTIEGEHVEQLEDGSYVLIEKED